MDIIPASEIQKQISGSGKAVLYIDFDIDKAILKANGILATNEIAKLMKANSELKISVEGHTDNTGSEEYNKRLSQDRAEAVVLELEQQNINSGRLKVVGYGSEKPLITNDTEDN